MKLRSQIHYRSAHAEWPCDVQLRRYGGGLRAKSHDVGRTVIVFLWVKPHMLPDKSGLTFYLVSLFVFLFLSSGLCPLCVQMS